MKLLEIYAKLPPRIEKYKPRHTNHKEPEINYEKKGIKNLPRFIKHINTMKVVADFKQVNLEFISKKDVTIKLYKNNRQILITYSKPIRIKFLDESKNFSKDLNMPYNTIEEFKKHLAQIEWDSSYLVRFLNYPELNFDDIWK